MTWHASIHPSLRPKSIHPSIHPPISQIQRERERERAPPPLPDRRRHLPPHPSCLSPSASPSAARACTCEIRPGSSRDPHAPLLPPVRRDPARTASSDQALGFGGIRGGEGRGIRRVWGAAGGDVAQDGSVPPRAGLRAAGAAAGPLHLLPSWLHFFVSYICYHEGCSHEEKPLLQDSLLPSSNTLTCSHPLWTMTTTSVSTAMTTPRTWSNSAQPPLPREGGNGGVRHRVEPPLR